MMTPFPPIPGGSRQGGWIPIHKALVRELPKDRPFTRLEAMFSLTLDYDQGNKVTVRGFSELWQWSRGKVERFLEEVGVSIQYPENTGQKQNQRGQIMIQITSRKRAENEQIIIIDSKWLSSQASRKQAESEQKTSRSQGTTNEPNPKPIIYSEIFESLWKNYPSNGRVKRKEAFRHFQASVKNDIDCQRIRKALNNYLSHLKVENWKKPQNASTWFNNWQDWENRKQEAGLKADGQKTSLDFMTDPAFDDAEDRYASA